MNKSVGFRFILVGILFGIIMTKSEAVSWFRIQEMFRFESFHMYGIIGSAVGLGVLLVGAIKRFKLKDIHGEPIVIVPKAKSVSRYILGGTIFGLGWAMTGACPGPMFVLLGQGVFPLAVVIISASVGTFVYGLVRDKLPH
ncbi:DUF6691 family protein [Sediminitomix flava]|uniref:Uncharacterized protein n=1 Tax=Sediminitomix flava TaxID=379075 RepID=A0A315ZDT0_SEDFL|nr:DUF6691 family protein [Sediminitomix flava]PWJ43776.1 hypothetical protein BC781_101122 [Sediminitomix flava]